MCISLVSFCLVIPHAAMSSAVVSSAADISLEFHPPTDITQKWTDLVISDLYDYNAKHNPNYPIFLFHDGQEKK